MLAATFWFVQSILIPSAIAIAFVIFIYGMVNYFIIGPGDEDRKEIGRENLIRANAGLVLILSLVLVIQGISWVAGYVGSPAGGEIFKDTKVQPVPNVPFQNE